MAEAILFNVTADIIFKLGSFALQEFGLAWGVNRDLDKLKHSLSAIQAVLHDAEEQQSKSHQVKAWVSRLKDVLYEIDDLMDESSYETLRRQVLAKDRRNRKQLLLNRLRKSFSPMISLIDFPFLSQTYGTHSF